MIDEVVDKDKRYMCVWNKNKKLTVNNPMYSKCVEECDGLDSKCKQYSSPYSCFIGSYQNSKSGFENRFV